MIFWKVYFWLFLTLFIIYVIVRISKILKSQGISKNTKNIIGIISAIPLLISNYLFAHDTLWLSSVVWRLYFVVFVIYIFYRIYSSKPGSTKRELKYEQMENPTDFYIGVGLSAATLAPALIALFIYAFLR